MNQENTQLPSKEIKIPHFISNSPVGEDLFEGKAQENVAECISNLLLNNEKCRIIGIDGGWGTGKSNLVELVKSKLGENFHFFIYDAWGHQEDLQRRSIIEELTEDLTSKSKILENPKWKKRLKDLLAKTREVDKKSIPSISFGIIVSVLLVILTPIAQAISSGYKPGEVSPFYKGLIVAAPLILAILTGGICFIYQWVKLKNEFDKKQFFKQMFNIYQKQQLESTTSETISEDEPSVKKFRDWMTDISDDLKKVKLPNGQQGKKLVLVFDNMDRLPRNKVQEIWSSIHTFFAENSYDNIRTIVPFDRERIKVAFLNEEYPQRSEKSSEDEEKEDKKTTTLYHCFGDDFINKTFNIIFRVSQPILSDWKNYFELKWTKAFGEIDREEFTKVIQIYDMLNECNTPREVVAFINEFVSIKLVIKDTIPDRYIALFIMGKNKILADPIKEIIQPTYLRSIKYLYINDDNLPQYIAALTYQINPEDAIQVIYTKRLRDALNNNELDKVKNISESKQFTHILENVIPELGNLENSILALNKIESNKYLSKIDEQTIWDNILSKIIEQSGSVHEQRLMEYQEILLLRITDKNRYINYILADFKKTESFNIIDYYEIVSKLETILLDNNIPIDVIKKLDNRKVSPEDFILFVTEAKNNYKKYKISCNKENLDDYLSKLPIEELNKITIIPNIKSEFRLPKYQSAIEALIPQHESNLSITKILFTRYKEFVRPIKLLLSDTYIYTHFMNLTKEDDFYYDLISMRIARQTAFHPSYVAQFNALLQSEDPIITEKVSERIEQYISYGDLLIGIVTFNSPLIAIVAQKITEKSYGVSTANIKTLIVNFETICLNGKIDPCKLISNLDRWKLPEISIPEIVTIPIFFFENAIKINCDLTKHIIEIANQYLESLSLEDWEEVLKETDSFDFRLSQLINYKYSQNAIEAIKFYLKGIAENETNVPNKEIWNKLINSLKHQGRRLVATFNGVRDVFCRKDNMTPELFIFFSEWLFEYASLEKRQETLRTIFPTSLIINDQCLKIIICHKEKITSILEAAGPEEASDFRDAILDILKYNTNVELLEFAKHIGAELPEENQENN